MRIGSRQAPQQQDAYSRASATPADFGAGVATALGALGRAVSERGEANVMLEAQERERQQRARNSANEIEMLRFEGEARRELMQSRVNQEAGAIGYTDEVNAKLQQSFDEFASRLELTPEERDRFATRFESFRQSAVTAAYAFEFEETNKKLIGEIGKTAEEIQEELRTNPDAFEARRDDIFAIIDAAPLPPTVKDALKEDTYTALVSVAYMAELETAMQGLAPAQDPETVGGDVVAPGAPAVQRGLAIAITSVESAGPGSPYTRLYGGGSFSDFSDHPRQYITITSGPNAGEKTSAAGRYQFLASTWDFVRAAMEEEGYDFGDQPFSPVNQDRAFWWYAQYRYRNKAKQAGFEGPLAELSTALAQGDIFVYESVRRMLSGEDGRGVVWEGLQFITAQQFMDRVAAGMEKGPLGTASAPDVWNNPRYADLSFDDKVALSAQAQRSEQARLKAIADARKEQEEAFMAQVRSMFAAGQSEQAYALGLQGIQNGTIRNITNIERVQREGREYREAFEAAQEQQVRRGAGQPALGTESGALDAEARLTGIAQGLRDRDGNARAAALSNFQADGRFPPSVSEILFAQLDSGDSAQQLFALEMLADAYSLNPRGATQGMTREQAEKAALAATLARFSENPAEFLQRYNRLRAPEGQTMRRQLLDEADKLFQEVGTTAIFNEMYGFFARNFEGITAPDIGDMPRFDHDARTLFREYYALFGDRKKAQQAAAEVLKHSYTPSPLTNRIMEFSPTAPLMGVPQVGGSHDWISGHVQVAVDTFINDFTINLTGQLQEQGVEDAGAQAVSMAEQLYQIRNHDVVADAQTLRDLQETGVPTYMISYTDRLGQPMVLMDQNNNIVRVPIAPSPETLRAAEVKAQLSHAQTRESNIDFEIERLEWSLRVGGGDFVQIPQPDGSFARMSEVDRRARLEELQQARQAQQLNSMEELISQMSPRELIALRNQMRPPTDYTQTDPYAQIVPPPSPSEVDAKILEMIDQYLYGVRP